MSWNGLKKALPFLWGGLVVAGFALFMREETRPAPSGTAALSAWPAEAPLALVPGRINLVLFAHPRCPCTRASLAEAAEAVARAGGPGRVALTVLFSVPAEEPAPWIGSPLWRAAAGMPGARVASDPDGRLAARFGATASGHVLFFDPAGRLRYSGGLTAARGREGDNAGLDAVSALARGASAAPTSPLSRPVYGCALVGPAPAPGRSL